MADGMTEVLDLCNEVRSELRAFAMQEIAAPVITPKQAFALLTLTDAVTSSLAKAGEYQAAQSRDLESEVTE